MDFMHIAGQFFVCAVLRNGYCENGHTLRAETG